jgi:hypothetical protein
MLKPLLLMGWMMLPARWNASGLMSASVLQGGRVDAASALGRASPSTHILQQQTHRSARASTALRVASSA